jgi:hypothetical protein
MRFAIVKIIYFLRRLAIPVSYFCLIYGNSSHAQSKLPPCSGDFFETPWTNCFGTHINSFGNKYVGEFVDGKREGQGVLTYSDGRQYSGGFKNNMYEGLGTITSEDKKFTGLFVKGARAPNQIFLGESMISSKSSQDIDALSEFKDKCKNLGFKTGTEGFGKCVLQLSR